MFAQEGIDDFLSSLLGLCRKQSGELLVDAEHITQVSFKGQTARELIALKCALQVLPLVGNCSGEVAMFPVQHFFGELRQATAHERHR